MNLTDSLQNVLSGVGTLNRYRLDIPSCPSSLDVEDFSGTEGISKIYRYDIILPVRTGILMLPGSCVNPQP